MSSCIANCALLLTYGSDRGADDANGRGLRNVRGLLKNESGLGGIQQITRGRKRQKENQEGISKRTRTPSRSGYEGHAGHGQPPPKAGCGAAGLEKARLLDLLYANRSTGHATFVDDTSPPMEEGPRSGQAKQGFPGDLYTASESPDASHGPDLAGAPEGVGGQRRDVSNEADSSEARSPEPRGPVSVQTLEPAHPETPDQHADPYPSKPNAETCRALSGAGQRSGSFAEIPGVEASGQLEGCTLAPPDLHPPGRLADSADTVARVHGLELAWNANETPQSVAEQASPDAEGTPGEGIQQGWTDPSTQREGEVAQLAGREDSEAACLLGNCFERIRLSNPDNGCFINASFLATCWAMLSTNSFTKGQWGPFATAISDFLQTRTFDPISVYDMPGFKLIADAWENRGCQGDPAEFLAHMLRGTEFQGFDMKWSARVQRGQLIHQHDHNVDACTPIVLQFDTAHFHDHQIQLQQMVMDWSNQHGHQYALTSFAPLICVQIDRFLPTGAGQFTKSDIAVNYGGCCAFPFFADDGMTVQWKDYQAIALIAHLGQDNAGHCKTLLKTEPALNDQMLILNLETDDWTTPRRIGKDPLWFRSNGTLLWMCHKEHLKLHVLPREPFQPTHTDVPPSLHPLDTLLSKMACS